MYKNISFILFLLAIGCDTNATAYKPISSGKIHTISVVIDNKLWNESPGEELQKIYSSEFLGLPQQEPLFTLNQIPPSIFTDFTRESRNIIVVSKSTKDSAFINSNKFASPQKILYINGKTNKSLVDQINKTARKAINTFKANEIKEKQKRIKNSILKTKEFDSLGNKKFSHIPDLLKKGTIAQQAKDKEIFFCDIPFTQLYMEIDGNYQPCCFGKPDGKHNILNTSMKEWMVNSPALNGIRKEMVDPNEKEFKNVNKYCTRCVSDEKRYGKSRRTACMKIHTNDSEFWGKVDRSARMFKASGLFDFCLLYTSPSPRDS